VALDFNQAHAARAKGVETVGRAKFGQADAQQGGGAHDGRARLDADLAAVDFETDPAGRVTRPGRAQILQ